jgi:hypothetical protein
MRRRIRQVRRWAAVGVVTVVALVLLGLAQTSPGASVLEKIGLDEPAEAYTELAFVRPHELPEELPARASYELRFQLHNAEGEPRTYRWFAETVTPASREATLIAHGSVALSPDEGTIVQRTVEVRCAVPRLLIRARLESPAQSVRFAVRCQPRTR